MNLTGTWPGPGDPADPFADEAYPADGWQDYANSGGDLDPEAYAARVAAFRVALADLNTGRETDAGDLARLARELRLDLAPDNEHRLKLLRCRRRVSHADLARIATDLCPAGGPESADRLLGPLAVDLDLLRAEHRATALAVLAEFCFTRPDGAGHPDGRSPQHGRTPFEQWCRRKPLPSAALRSDIRALARAPLGVWSLERQTPGGWLVADRLGLAPHVLPDGPVTVHEHGAPIRPARAGDTLLARIAPTPTGWVASSAVVLPSAPPGRRLRSWRTLALWEARLLDRRLTVEDLQRRSAHTLFRRVVEWAWLTGDDDPYRDAVLYDLEYSDHEEDVDYYRRLARRTRGPILELGCGTGRLTMAMAETGATVDGVDLAQPMLDRLDARLTEEPPALRSRVRVWQADFRLVESDRTYGMVVWPFNALHHCRGPDEVREVLDRVRALLRPGGVLAVDCYLPAVDLYDRDPAQRIEPRSFTRPDTGETLQSWEQGWWDAEASVHHVVYVYRRPDGTETHTHLQLRMYPLDELRRLFRDAGWSVRSHAEDFRGSPLTWRSLKYVALFEPAG